MLVAAATMVEVVVSSREDWMVSNLPCAKNFEIHTLHRNYESQGESNPYLLAMWRMQTVYPYPSLDHRVVILCEKIMLPLSLIIHFLI